jgi:hypothetical protein
MAHPCAILSCVPTPELIRAHSTQLDTFPLVEQERRLSIIRENPTGFPSVYIENYAR